jgi:hypothetical protein
LAIQVGMSASSPIASMSWDVRLQQFDQLATLLGLQVVAARAGVQHEADAFGADEIGDPLGGFDRAGHG